MSATPHAAQGPKLLDRLRTAWLIRGTKPELVQAQVGWVRAFIHFHNIRHPETRGAGEPTSQPLLEQMRAVLRVKHYAPATEDAYLNWVKRFIVFHGKRHPLEMREEEIEGFLTYLAVECEVAASTQNQAFHALLGGGAAAPA